MSQQLPASLPRRARIGIDATQQPPLAVAAWRTAGGIRTAKLSPAMLHQMAGDGSRVALALPMQHVFCEFCEVPARSRQQAERLAYNMLDLRLPLPVERCVVVWCEGVASHSSRALLAYATPDSFLTELLAEPDTPDAGMIVPAAEPLWQSWPQAWQPTAPEVALLLHVSGKCWSLLVGRGSQLQSCLTLATGDVTAVGRTLQVFLERWEAHGSRLYLTGPAADEKLLRQLESEKSLAETRVRLDKCATESLATHLAVAALSGKVEADLRNIWQPHPCQLVRRRQRALAVAAVVLLAATVTIGSNLWQLQRTRRYLKEGDAALAAAAELMAGRRLPGRGAAAIELARNEMEGRLNPSIEAFGENSLLELLPELLHIASLRGITLATLAVDDRRIELKGSASNDSDIEVMRTAAQRRGLIVALESLPTETRRIAFSGTLMHKGVLP